MSENNIYMCLGGVIDAKFKLNKIKKLELDLNLIEFFGQMFETRFEK